MSIAYEVQPRHPQALFIDAVVIKRIAFRHMGHADGGIMMAQLAQMPQSQGVSPGHNDDLLPVGTFIIQCPTKVEVLCRVSDGRTHKIASIWEV